MISTGVIQPRTCRAVSIGVLLAAASARADAPPPIRVLLADPVQLAAWLRDHDPASRASQAKITQAHELAEQAGVYQNPQLNLGVNDISLGVGNLPPSDPTM